MTKLLTTRDFGAQSYVDDDGQTQYTGPEKRTEPVQVEVPLGFNQVAIFLDKVAKFAKIAKRHGQEVTAVLAREEQVPHSLFRHRIVTRYVYLLTVPPLVGVKGRILAHFERAEDGKSQYVHMFDEPRRAEFETYVPRAGQCDHCRVNQRRNDSYVCEVEGRIMMVGSKCLMDFLGIDPAWAMIACQWAKLTHGDEEYDEDRPRGRGGVYLDTAELVYEAYRVARMHGGYSREIGDVMHTEVGCLIRPGADELTAKIKAKYRDFKPEFDANAFETYVETASGDFGSNLRIALAQDEVEVKRMRLVIAGVGLFVGRALKREEDAKKPVVITKAFDAAKGQRIDFEAEIVRTYVRDGVYGETCIITLRTEDGRQAVNFHTGRERPEAGSRYQVRGTVKRHQDAFKGHGRETILARCTYKEAAQ